MNNYIDSSVTPEEFFRYHCTDERAIGYYEQSRDELIDDHAELEIQSMEDEEVIASLKEEVKRLKGK